MADDAEPTGEVGAHAAPIPFERIRERAYELWERNHRPEGFEIEFWLLAERELRRERDRAGSAETATQPRPDGDRGGKPG